MSRYLESLFQMMGHYENVPSRTEEWREIEDEFALNLLWILRNSLRVTPQWS